MKKKYTIDLLSAMIIMSNNHSTLLQREELTAVILKLLVAWRKPLWRFHQSMAHYSDFNKLSSNRALEMSDMVHELQRGVEKVAEKVKLSDDSTCSVANQKVVEKAV